jgi:hypothetical protein
MGASFLKAELFTCMSESANPMNSLLVDEWNGCSIVTRAMPRRKPGLRNAARASG